MVVSPPEGRDWEANGLGFKPAPRERNGEWGGRRKGERRGFKKVPGAELLIPRELFRDKSQLPLRGNSSLQGRLAPASR